MNYCAILASGIGSRMGSWGGAARLPKQFIEINRYPLLCYTVKTVIETNIFDKVFIAFSKEYINYGTQILQKFFSDNDLRIVIGAEKRMDTFYNVIDSFMSQLDSELTEDDYMCLTDANRPLTSGGLYRDCMEGAYHYGICCPARPVTDGIAIVRNQTIQEIPDKPMLYSIQTPECFRIKDLFRICPNRESLGNNLGVVELFSDAGISPHIIKSDDRSFKITTPIDFEVLQSYLSQ